MAYAQHYRSLLSTPASATELYLKGHRAGADICVLDLEDSTPPRDKERARRQAETFFSMESAAATRCGIRINAVTELEGLRDLIAMASYSAKPATIVIPKAESPRDIEIVEKALGEAAPGLEFLAVVETPRGVENVNSIATASPRLRALIFGSADYSIAAGARLAWECLVHARARVVNSARAAEIEAIDAPSFSISDPAALRHEAMLARDLGFGGKVALTPRQVSVINEVFSPDPQALESARRVAAVASAGDLNIAVVDGVMLGRPFFEASQRMIAEFGDGPAAAQVARQARA